MLKSYYDILNVPSNATKNEIKNQFKKLVKMYHPDLNPSIEAEEIFKEINRAADILLDDTKRKNYDNLRSINKKIHQKTEQNKNGYTFYDVFQKKNGKKAEISKKGDDITVNIKIDFQEALLGTYRIINIAKNTICEKCSGHKFINGQKCIYCEGKGEKTLNRKITVKIPPNLKNGSKLRLKGEGHEGFFGGENGNLYVIVDVDKKSEFEIKNDIVYCEAAISPYTAVLGGNVKVNTLWGEAVIKIPPLTKSGQSFKLIDVGIFNPKTSKKGDEIVKIIIQIPSEITDEEYRLYEKLREINLKNGAAI